MFCRAIFRYEASVMRARFDATREVKDMRYLAELLEDAQEAVFQAQQWDPFIYRNDEDGITYGRIHGFGSGYETDSKLDGWHPWEKVE